VTNPSKKARDAAEDVAGTHHGPALPTYFVIFGALMVLTAVTVTVAYLDVGGWAAPIAVAIASVKATLVVLYFMHMKYSSRLIALHATSGLLFLAILLGITMAEVAGRGPTPAAMEPATDPLRPNAPALGRAPPPVVEPP
jgi:cytochrome c oxidase subunit 4